MPRRNRVDPFGHVVAHPARGLMMGNRGCLHDEAGRIVRESAASTWIACVLEGPRRQIMRPGWYTELFFLDEATALAAGHRPCGSCRVEAFDAFKRAWALAHPTPALPRAAEMNAVLRAAPRLQLLRIRDELDALPDGAMIALADQPLLRWRGRWLPWTFEGYRDPVEPDATWAPTLLTSTPMLEVLRAGYRPMVHSSAESSTAATT